MSWLENGQVHCANALGWSPAARTPNSIQTMSYACQVMISLLSGKIKQDCNLADCRPWLPSPAPIGVRVATRIRVQSPPGRHQIHKGNALKRGVPVSNWTRVTSSIDIYDGKLLTHFLQPPWNISIELSPRASPVGKRASRCFECADNNCIITHTQVVVELEHTRVLYVCARKHRSTQM